MVTSNSTARPNSLRATARVLSSPSSRVVPRSTPTVPASVCGQCSVPRLERRGGSMRRPARVVVPVAVLALTAYLSADVADVVPGVLTASVPAAAPVARPTPSDPARTPAEPALPALSDQAPRPATA